MYKNITQFEPLLPSEAAIAPLLELSNRLIRAATALDGKLSAASKSALAPLLREMNSYYTNRIEGQHTFPIDIQRALEGAYSEDPNRASRQRLALAHIRTEEWGEKEFDGADWQKLYSTEVVKRLHRHLYNQLPEADRQIEDGSAVTPGALRTREVQVGSHVAPQTSSLQDFLSRWETVYSHLPSGERALIGAACAHHRLTWIHPFEDGNGRVARLHSHLLLRRMGLSGGLWSPMRGMARSKERYYAFLSGADMPRAGDLDGRGNLSETGLLGFAQYFIETCLDQVQFMSDILDFAGMRSRLREFLTLESLKPKSSLRPEAANALHYLFLAGTLPRGDFKKMTGLAPRTAERLLAELLRREILLSDTPKGPVRFGIPLWALRYFFPNLWTEAEADISPPLTTT